MDSPKLNTQTPPEIPVLTRTIGGTTYIVRGCCSPRARETAKEKTLRLILAEAPNLKDDET